MSIYARIHDLFYPELDVDIGNARRMAAGAIANDDVANSIEECLLSLVRREP